MSLIFITFSCMLLLCYVSLLIEKKLHKRYRVSDAVINEGFTVDIFLNGFDRAVAYPDAITGYIVRLVAKRHIPLQNRFHAIFPHTDVIYITLGLGIACYLFSAHLVSDYTFTEALFFVSMMFVQFVMCLPIIANIWYKQRKILPPLWYMSRSRLSTKQKQRLARLFINATKDNPYVMMDKIICFLYHSKDARLIQDILPLLKHSQGSLHLALLMWCKKHNLSPIDALSTDVGKRYQHELLTISTMDNSAVYKQCTNEDRKHMTLGDFFVGTHLPPAYRKLVTTT